MFHRVFYRIKHFIAFTQFFIIAITKLIVAINITEYIVIAFIDTKANTNSTIILFIILTFTNTFVYQLMTVSGKLKSNVTFSIKESFNIINFTVASC